MTVINARALVEGYKNFITQLLQSCISNVIMAKNESFDSLKKALGRIKYFILFYEKNILFQGRIAKLMHNYL